MQQLESLISGVKQAQKNKDYVEYLRLESEIQPLVHGDTSFESLKAKHDYAYSVGDNDNAGDIRKTLYDYYSYVYPEKELKQIHDSVSKSNKEKIDLEEINIPIQEQELEAEKKEYDDDKVLEDTYDTEQPTVGSFLDSFYENVSSKPAEEITFEDIAISAGKAGVKTFEESIHEKDNRDNRDYESDPRFLESPEKEDRGPMENIDSEDYGAAIRAQKKKFDFPDIIENVEGSRILKPTEGYFNVSLPSGESMLSYTPLDLPKTSKQQKPKPKKIALPYKKSPYGKFTVIHRG